VGSLLNPPLFPARPPRRSYPTPHPLHILPHRPSPIRLIIPHSNLPLKTRPPPIRHPLYQPVFHRIGTDEIRWIVSSRLRKCSLVGGYRDELYREFRPIYRLEEDKSGSPTHTTRWHPGCIAALALSYPRAILTFWVLTKRSYPLPLCRGS
jgi:hypothetical protein